MTEDWESSDWDVKPGWDDQLEHPLPPAQRIKPLSFAEATKAVNSQDKELSVPAEDSAPRPRIVVGTPESVGSFRKFFVYRVIVEGLENKAVKHRYSDFAFLRTHLLQCFPVSFVPPIPPKQTFGSTDPGFLRYRMRDLERFLNRVANNPAFAAEPVFKKFLELDWDKFEVAKKELCDALNVRDIAQVYQKLHLNVVYEYQSKPPEPEAFVKIKTFLDVSKDQLTRMLSVCDNMLKKYLEFCGECESLSRMFDTFSLHDKKKVNTGKEYSILSRVEVAPCFQRWNSVNHQMTDHYLVYMMEVIQHEIEDIESFAQALEAKSVISRNLAKAELKRKRWERIPVETDKQREEKDQVSREFVWVSLF